MESSRDMEPDVFPRGFIDLIEVLVTIARNTEMGKRSIAREVAPKGVYAVFSLFCPELARRGILATTSGKPGVIPQTGPRGIRFLVSPSEITVGEIARIAKSFLWPADTRQRSAFPLLNTMREWMIAEMDAITIADLMAGELRTEKKEETIVERYERTLPKMLDGLIEAGRQVQKRRTAEIDGVLRSGVLSKGD
jgi:hypothetical protein